MIAEKIKMPWVSFCMSTYKRPVFLKQQLQIILKQNFKDFEVVICDNDPECSARGVVSLIGDPRIKYLPNNENLGMIKSFNRSIENSSSEYIVMITDDDPIYPDMLETMVSLVSKYQGYGMYLGGCDLFCTHYDIANLYGLKVGTNSCLSNNHDLNHVKTFEPYEFVKDIFSAKIFSHYLWSTGIVKREVLIEMGGVPDYGTPFLGDYAYLSIMGAHSGCVIINKSLGCQTVHNENFGRSQNEQLPIVAVNFPKYLFEKISYLPQWKEIEKLIHHFVGVWVTGHMAFLHHYNTGNNDQNKASFLLAEKEIFQNNFMKKYKIKYFLKKNFPLIHDNVLKLKRAFVKPTKV